ncbi:MAG TPA: OstA-like protein [Saprospiraceae bacterium]|nr:OstA-like protein [Saprospiraceae bacterium]HPN69685.1 OstA-like protein [Saprospiraceae bacterium]
MTLSLQWGFAQNTSNKDSVSSSQIIVENADQAIVETGQTPQVTKYLGNVRAYHEGAFIFCDNAILTGNNLYAVGNVSILEADTLQIYADTLIYQGDSSLAYLVKDVILINNQDTLYAPDLKYNLSTKVADYVHKALMKDATNTLKSQFGTYNTATKEAWFYTKVSVDGDSLSLLTDTLRYNTESKQAAWYAPAIIKNKNARLFSKSGDYNLDTKNGIFMGEAQYEEDTITALADTIIYDGVKNHISLLGNASYVSQSDTATSDTIIYDRENELIELIGKADYRGKDNSAKGDKLRYDKKNETFKFEGRSQLADAPLFIDADFLDYDKNKQLGYAVGNVVYRDTSEGLIIWADTLDYDGTINFMRATAQNRKPVMGTEIDGDTLYITARVLRTYRKIIDPKAAVIDTLSKMQNDSIKTSQDSLSIDSVKTNELIDSQSIDYINLNKIDKGSEPKLDSLFIKKETGVISKTDSLHLNSQDSTIILLDTNSTIKMDSMSIKKDSIYINFNDSLMVDTSQISGLDSINYLIAEDDVVLYKSDLQARADSLAYNDLDSIFTLFYNPVMWTDTTQILGDTIRIGLRDNKISSLVVNDNAFMINSTDFKFFNQIGGKVLVGEFEEGEMKLMRVNGNAQIVYYMLDDEDAYIGANTTDCSYMVFYFTDKKISDIRFYNSPQSKILPMQGTNHEDIKLKNFNLRFSEQPKNKDELFQPTPLTIQTLESPSTELKQDSEPTPGEKKENKKE